MPHRASPAVVIGRAGGAGCASSPLPKESAYFSADAFAHLPYTFRDTVILRSYLTGKFNPIVSAVWETELYACLSYATYPQQRLNTLFSAIMEGVNQLDEDFKPTGCVRLFACGADAIAPNEAELQLEAGDFRSLAFLEAAKASGLVCKQKPVTKQPKDYGSGRGAATAGPHSLLSRSTGARSTGRSVGSDVELSGRPSLRGVYRSRNPYAQLK